MIYNFLTTHPDHRLRINVTNQNLNVATMTFYAFDRITEFYLTGAEANPNPQTAYFLPWQRDTGLHLDLPGNNLACNLFLTSALSGCSLVIERLAGGGARVRHWNGDLSQDDFLRLGNVACLVPQDRQLDGAGNQVHFYNGNACFWGEFNGGAWDFYFQTPDKRIHAIRY